MNGSGCINCPVKECKTMQYRDSTCAEQRVEYGLYDPLTNAERIRALSNDELARFLIDVEFVSLTADVCNEKYCDHNCDPCPHDCKDAVKRWLESEMDGTGWIKHE